MKTYHYLVNRNFCPRCIETLAGCAEGAQQRLHFPPPKLLQCLCRNLFLFLLGARFRRQLTRFRHVNVVPQTFESSEYHIGTNRMIGTIYALAFRIDSIVSLSMDSHIVKNTVKDPDF